MTDQNKPMTHIAWAKHFRGRQFRKWVEVGEGRIELAGNGVATAHLFADRTVRGDTGYICLLPIGLKPPDPAPQAKRPSAQSDEEEDF